jgi:hypothetical protein
MRNLILAVAALSLAVASEPALAQQKVPVQFAKGASSAKMKGAIKGDQFRDYTVNARAGQTMTVTLSNPDGRAFFNVLPPGSTGEAVFVGSTSGNSFRGPVPGNGVTTIRVYQMRATARRGEVANYSLAIGIAGASGATSTDAKVAGTSYNATSIVRCGRNPDELTGRCQAGVKRSGNGTASVSLTTPQNGRRTIQFNGTRVTSTDGGVPFQVNRLGDMNIVSVGDYEVYEIPDALIVGG